VGEAPELEYVLAAQTVSGVLDVRTVPTRWEDAMVAK